MKEVFSYKKLVSDTRCLVKRLRVPKHWSKKRNEVFDVHLVCVAFVLYIFDVRSYRLFCAALVTSTVVTLPRDPHWTTLEKAFKRLPPRLLRVLAQQAGRCRHTLRSLDPTYFQTTNPSASYCARIGRDMRKYKGRKVSVVVCPRCRRVSDVFLRAQERHGLRDVPQLLQRLSAKTLLADKEYDAEHFHVQIARGGGRAIVPPRYVNVPVWRTRGVHRKRLKRSGVPRVYRFRAHSEANNHAVKTRFGHTLRGRTFWQQARSCYGKYLVYNLLRNQLQKLFTLTFY